ncbi:unnamed protein product, partial [Meganyctiphanes norvegica]
MVTNIVTKNLKKCTLIFTVVRYRRVIVLDTMTFICFFPICKMVNYHAVLQKTIPPNNNYIINMLVGGNFCSRHAASGVDQLLVYDALMPFRRILNSFYNIEVRVNTYPQKKHIDLRGEVRGRVLALPSVASIHIPYYNTAATRSAPELFEKRQIGYHNWLYQLIINVYEFFRICMRGAWLFTLYTPVIILYPITHFGKKATELWWKLLLSRIELSGAMFIKLGQWGATRRDIFPEDVCRNFSRLQRSVQPHSWHFTKYRLSKAFGPNWRKIFVKFDNNREPIGSGCVAQIYKAWMRTDYIADEALVQEVLSVRDDDEKIINFHDGLEVLGFGRLFSFKNQENKEEKEAIELYKQRKLFDKKETEVELESEELEEHSLVQDWTENPEPMNKALPFEDKPPDNMDGLIPVAIKVLHPSIQSTFRRDLKLMKVGAQVLTKLIPPLRWFSLSECVEEFSLVMSQQVDLRTEAENLEIFKENFANVTNVNFPKPLQPFVKRKVLVETLEEGIPMIEFIGSSGENYSENLKSNLAKIGVDAILKMIFVDNFVHGDLHPGNILVQNISDTPKAVSGNVDSIMMLDVGDTLIMDIKPDPKPMRICILDCGFVASLAKQDLMNFRAVFENVVLGDGRAVGEVFLEHSNHECKDPEAFNLAMSELVGDARKNAISLGQVDVGVLLQKVLSTLQTHCIHLDSAFSAVVLAVFILEGLGRSLDSNMDILKRARPVLLTGRV